MDDGYLSDVFFPLVIKYNHLFSYNDYWELKIIVEGNIF